MPIAVPSANVKEEPSTIPTASSAKAKQEPTSDRLILCFDGTGNVFTGTPGDTNIVKLYKMFNRENRNQMHYYQPGIGTYPAEGPVNVSYFRTFLRKIETILDSALATSFDSHVIAGYKFIMRHYKPGDRIYIFGFSRGAFTARFVSRMISHVGLLSRGNEELIPFAYKVYQDYESNSKTHNKKDQVKFMNSFKDHFCRTEVHKKMDESGKPVYFDDNGDKISKNESGIKVHFLGLFDCVSSVGNLDIPFFQTAPPLPAVAGTAKHIRHAVAIDERRVKFKAALFAQEPLSSSEENIKEVWFPGNHGDIGGGWDIEAIEDGKPRETYEDDYFQLSDIALKWMIDEVDAVDLQTDLSDRVAWDPMAKTSFLNRFETHKDEMIKARMHDTMQFGGGVKNPLKILLWKWMEYIPWIIRRWEYMPVSSSENDAWSWVPWFFRSQPCEEVSDNKWRWNYTSFPPNCGGRRDIPSEALFHQSVIERMRLDASTVDESYHPQQYVPSNQISVAEGDKPSTKVIVVSLDKLIPTVKQNDPIDEETQPLKSSSIEFDYLKAITTGSVEVIGDGGPRKYNIGPQDWDRIYRVRSTGS